MKHLRVPLGIVLFALPILALTGVACSDDGGTTVLNTSTDQVGITVSGTGEVIVEPDTGYFDVGVNVTRTTVAEAREAAATSATRLIDSVKKNGVDAKDITTSSFSIYPQYNYPRDGGQPTITGYQVSNTVSVKVRKLDDFSQIIDDAAEAGGDDTRINGIRFGLEDDQKAIDEARGLAMDDAKKKASQLASAGDVTLGKPVAISEVNFSSPEAYYADKVGAAPAAGSPTPIEPGTGKVTVTVTVRYAISG
ncbi:MAG: SIMPL domain-containing protein [Dehalococcoidia bacterium]|nr:SIMPL domain-containing protein [Dehalococcoidia bacterium]